MKTLILSWTAMLLMVSCTTTNQKNKNPKIYADKIKDRMIFMGFSIARPEDLLWYTIAAESAPRSIKFYKDYPNFNHIFTIQASLLTLPKIPKDNDDFTNMVALSNRSSIKTISKKHKVSYRNGKLCYFYETTYYKTKELNMGMKTLYRTKGFTSYHPHYKDKVVNASWTESGTPNELKASTVRKDADSFLKNIQLEKPLKI